MNPEEKLIDAETLSEYLAVKVGTIYHWVSQKRIPHVKLGRCVRFDLEQINQWKERNSVHPIDISL